MELEVYAVWVRGRRASGVTWFLVERRSGEVIASAEESAFFCRSRWLERGAFRILRESLSSHAARPLSRTQR